MNPRYKKIYTCTPVAFHANDGFFIRDTGLITTSLISMGIESKSIMPLPYHDDDQKENIIRTSMKNLKSEEWWRSLGIDGLVLYSWGAPRYTAIAKAIHKAGIRLVVHMDTSGDFDKMLPELYTPFKALLKWCKASLQNYFRSKHLKYADVITMPTPVAHVISKLPFFDNFVIEKNFPMPCPVAPSCVYDGRTKRDIIIAAGRWDDTFQKRPRVLMQTLEHLYARHIEAETHIYGNLTPEILNWHQSLNSCTKNKIILKGYQKNSILRDALKEAKIVLCTSSFEGCHIVSTEGLCCGCSVVTPNRPAPLRSLIWYTTKNSGTVSVEDTAESLAQALIHELGEWHEGRRNPALISSAWTPHFHTDKVLPQLFP